MRLVFDLDELEDELDAETQDILEDVANTLVNELTREAPMGATGDLRRSMQIFRRSSGEIVLGSRLNYAEDVQEGRGPHEADFEALQIWARRKLGNESAAGAVWRKIAAEGTNANPYVDRAFENTLQSFR